MTISSTTNRKEYTGNGVTTAFAFPYPFEASTDLRVFERTIATGAIVEKTAGTDFTVTGAGSPSGGTVTATSAPANTVNWIIVRDPARTQGVALVNGEKIDVDAAINTPLDALTLMVQRQNDRADRALHAPDGDLTANAAMEIPNSTERANKVLSFDANGLPTVQDPAVTTAVQAAADAKASAAAAGADLWSRPVDDIVPTEPSPTIGKRVLLDETNATHPNQIAEYFVDGWHYSGAPAEGQVIYVGLDAYTFDGAAWSKGDVYKPAGAAAYLNLQRWLDGNYINAGRPSDNTFTHLQDALDLSGNPACSPRNKKVIFDGSGDDCWTITEALKIYPRSGLWGHGSGITEIKIADGANCQALTEGNADPEGDDIAHARYIDIGGFKINANKANQTAAAAGAIVSFGGGAHAASNCMLNMRDVFVAHTYAGVDSFSFGANLQGMKGDNLTSYDSGGRGFFIGCTDAQFSRLESGQSALAGIFCDSAFYTQIRGFKSWWAGNGGDAAGCGLVVYRSRGMTIDGQIQDCGSYGLQMYGSGDSTDGTITTQANRLRLNIDSVKGAIADLSGGYLTNNVLELTGYTVFNVLAIPGYTPATCVIQLADDTLATVSENHFRIMRSAIFSGTVAKPFYIFDGTRSNIGNNTVEIEGHNGPWYALTPADSSTVTPSAHSKGSMRLNVTAPFTIGAADHPYDGQVQDFFIVQDATGHAITWDASWKVVTASGTYNAANARLLLRFRYDYRTSSWYQLQ